VRQPMFIDISCACRSLYAPQHLEKKCINKEINIKHNHVLFTCYSGGWGVGGWGWYKPFNTIKVQVRFGGPATDFKASIM
jgi:hypothetical protein